MTRIQKTISLEPMTSRLPSVVPAYMNNVLYTFDNKSLKERNYAYTSNYGMIPCNIPIPNDICGNNGDRCNVISFERLSIWYHKFKEYYNLLNRYSHCNTVYTSAHEYYENEVKLWPEDLYYGTSEQTYIDLDEEIECMGGKVSAITTSYTIDCSGNKEPKNYQMVDVGFYNWICEHVIPTYTITKKYQDYWQRDTLYYPDVIKWVGWFDERNKYSGYTTEESCKNSSNCCECINYVKLGGAEERNKMYTWYDNVQTNISGLNDTIVEEIQPTECDISSKKAKECYVPMAITPIELQNSIEDLGEFSIFCEEYKAGVDYRCAEQGATANTLSGTVVTKDGKALILQDGYKGYTFDPDYMEVKFDKDAWSAMTISNNNGNISGLTSSKLNSLYVDNYLVDDIGNLIEGLYDVSGKTNHQPLEGSVLEPVYQVGHIYNVVRNENVDGQFIGDEIDSMLFYYMTVDGTKDINGSKKAKKDEALSAITSTTATSAATKLYYEDIFCDVEYHIGNIYSASTVEICDENNENCINVEQLNLIPSGEGVSYMETVQFVKTRTEYYLKRKPKDYTPDKKSVPSAHTVSYPIYVYKLKQAETEIVDNTYNTPYNDSLSTINYSVSRGYDDTDSKLPIIREEYKLGIAAPQSVKGNIYIDRGINAAFEKHLKIGECVTLESLLQYGNGYFKIMEN